MFLKTFSMKRVPINQFNHYLISRIKKGVLNGKKLFYEIKNQGYKGSYTSLYRHLKNNLNQDWKKSYRKRFFEKNQSFNLTDYKTAIRFETEPGVQAQVDWGHFGKIEINGRTEKLYCFVFVLSYSRILYLEFTIKQNLSVFECCHINAFKALGIPESIVYDNTKTVVLSREKLPDGSTRIYLNPAFEDFTNYYGFRIKVSPPYWPRNKGKVESGVKYVRYNFALGLNLNKSFSSLETLNKEALRWTKTVANVRMHSTTGESPLKKWKTEKPYLKFPNNLPDYQVSPFIFRYSTKDQLVQYKQNFYSVPKEFAWKKLFIREINENGNIFVHIYYQNILIYKHRLSLEKVSVLKIQNISKHKIV